MNYNFTTLRFDQDANTGIKRFVRVHTFTEEESQLIADGMDTMDVGDNIHLYFNDIGNVVVKNGEESVLNFYPKTMRVDPQNVDFQTSTQGKTNKIDFDVTSFIGGEVFIYSKPLGKWILYSTNLDSSDPIFHLYFNPIPVDYAKRMTNVDTTSLGLNNLANYCIEVKGKDPVCVCINKENEDNNDDTEYQQFCMNDLLGSNKVRAAVKKNEIKANNLQQYNAAANNCHCFNLNCNKLHPVRKVLTEIKSCPNKIVMTSCTVQVGASEGGSVETGNMNVQQECGATVEDSTTEQNETTINGGNGGGGTERIIERDRRTDTRTTEREMGGGGVTSVDGKSGSKTGVIIGGVIVGILLLFLLSKVLGRRR